MTLSDARQPGVQRRGDRRRRELLEGALRVIGKGGLRALTHRSVAAEAGVPVAATTYYFSSKDDLVIAALQHAADEEIAELEQRIAALEPSNLSPADWADELVAWLSAELRGRARLRLLARYQLQLEAVHRRELRQIYDAWTRATFHLAERMLAAAGSRAPAADAVIVMAAVDGMRLNRLTRNRSSRASGSLRPALERLMAALLA